MEMHDSFDDLSDDKGALELVQKTPFLNILKQILAIDVLHDKILISFRSDFLFVKDNLWMVDYFEDLALISDEFYGPLCQLLNLNHFDGIFFPCLLFFTFVDDGKVSSSYHVTNLIIHV